jgi:hypothetical protein
VLEPEHGRHHRIGDREVDRDVRDADLRFKSGNAAVVESTARDGEALDTLVDDEMISLRLALA